MADINEVTLELPIKLVENCSGFSMDFGSSALKLVYRHKEDWDELKNQDPSIKTAKLRLLTYSVLDYKEALDHLRQHCVTREEGMSPQLTFTTGVGCCQYSETIKNTLKINTKNVLATDCFVKSFCYLSRMMSRKEFEYEISSEMRVKLQQVDEYAIKLVSFWKQLLIDGNSKMTSPDVDLNLTMKASSLPCDGNQPVATELPNFYPCLVAMIGSAAVFLQVNVDESYQVVDVSNRGGRTFLGLGSQLVGATKTYKQLIEMAVKGDSKKVDTSRNDFKLEQLSRASGTEEASKDDPGLYASWINNDDWEDELSFCFGKARYKEKFEIEDVIRSLLNTMILDVIQTMKHVMMLRKVRHCFVCGSFINHQLVRDLINVQFQRKEAFNLPWECRQVLELHLVRNGAYFGALGALMKNVENLDTSHAHS